MKQSTKAAPVYAQLVSNYPLSSYVDPAKNRLVALHQPVPKPTKAVLARARADALRPAKPSLLARLGQTVSSAPDYRTTRHGPAQLGGGKPAETQAAKTTAPAPGSNTIVVQPVPDSALNPNKPADPKTGDNGSNSSRQDDTSVQKTSQQDGAQQDPNAKAAGPSTSQSNTSSEDVPPPRKKKGKLHFFKKMVP